jgi:NAD(P)-dependent dehydrogenase (short-subunit alcohol dehydrogenase family)
MTRSILITGWSSGIGLCAAEGLQARGWRVFATARKPADVAMLTAKGLEALQLDLDDSASIQRALDEVLARSGGTLDALFNNAGYGQPGAVEDLSRAVLRAQFETNLFGMIELTNRVIPVMRRQGHGRIVQNSSILGYIVLAYRGAYNASKFAIEGITDTLRLELRGTGIHVSLIEPGPIKSHFRANAFAAYQQNIDAQASAHRDCYAAMEARLQKAGPAAPFTLGPEAVLEKLIHALESPRPRARYPVTKPAVFFAVAKRLLPGAWLDRILGKISDRETQ